jgi:hypothetical protein
VLVVGIIGLSLIGVNTVVSGLRSLERALLVENVRAEEVVRNLTWQEEVMVMIRNAGLDTDKANKLIFCESSWNPDNVHYNVHSVDRGLWQINSYYHSEVSQECAYDALCSTKEAIRIIKEKGWSEWSCVEKDLI